MMQSGMLRSGEPAGEFTYRLTVPIVMVTELTHSPATQRICGPVLTCGIRSTLEASAPV